LIEEIHVPRKNKAVVRKQMGDLGGTEIRRHWGDIPVVDAKKDIRIFFDSKDVANAKRLDPTGCIFAQACKRQFGATKVIILRTVAYMDLPDRKGNRRVERFEVAPEMRDIIEAFDRGEGVLPAGGFEFSAPSESHSLDGKRQQQVARVQAKRPAMIVGTAKGGKGKLGRGNGKYRDKPMVLDYVRRGTGMVHFTMSRDACPPGTKPRLPGF